MGYSSAVLAFGTVLCILKHNKFFHNLRVFMKIRVLLSFILAIPFSLLQASTLPRTVDSFVLYQILEHVEKSRPADACKLVHEATVLLQSIVTDFDNGCFAQNPEIQSKFFAVCDVCQGVPFEEIEPHNLRAQVKKAKEFNAFMLQYASMRNIFWNQADFKLFNKMVRFNKIIIVCCSQEQLFDIDYATKTLDWLVHRPSEFMYEYRWPLLAGAAVIAGGVLLYYYYPKQEPENPSAIRQINGRVQQGQECGFYAALHAAHVVGAQTEEEVAQRLQAVQQVPDAAINDLRDRIDRERQLGARGNNVGINNLTNDEVEALVQQGGLDGRRHNIPVVQQLADLDNPVQVVGGFELNPSTRIFNENVQDFRTHHTPQTAVLNVGGLLGGGHWVAVHVMPDQNEPLGIRAIAINSSGGNLVDHPVVRGFVERYALLPQARGL